MKTVVAAFIVALMATVVPNLHAADTKEVAGTWVAEKGEGLPKGTILELTKEGKLKINIEIGEKKQSIEGTYKVDGDKLNVAIKNPEGKEETKSLVIKEATKDKLVLSNNDKVMEFKKK